MEKVSVIIPTFNRFKYVLNTINSVKNQTYSNIEIIVVNDCSSEKDYYTHNWDNEGVIFLNLKQNSKKKFGYGSAANTRNKGIEISTGSYIAFCDDDDIWFPNKLELQVNAMKDTGCKMCCTEGLIGNGIYNQSNYYKKYNTEHYYKDIQNIYKKKNSKLLDNGYPKIWNYEFIKIHNSIICSSVIIKKEILNTINNFIKLNPPGEDYDCWIRALKYTDCVYIDDICFYYDIGHGKGRNY